MTTPSKGVIPGHLIPSQQPALVLSPNEYTRSYQDSLNNILRLYFSQIDNFTTNLLTNEGGRFLGFPHIGAYDSTSQYATGNNIGTVVKWSVLESGIGFTLNDGSSLPYPANSATALNTGIYKIDYSLQFVNSDSQAHIVYVWLKVNGTNVVESASKFSIPSKHGSFNGASVAYSSLTFEMTAGDYVELYWATDLAYVASPLTNGVFMEASPIQTIGTPPNTTTLPSIPSAVGTIAFISNTPA